MLSDKYIDPLMPGKRDGLCNNTLSEEDSGHHSLMFITQIGRQLYHCYIGDHLHLPLHF